ncbi:MAG: hypothetical protein ACE145_04350 [Terriglobia bacterium]
MTIASKSNRLEGSAAGRRSTRISIAIPITISGKDATGRAFKENTRTIILNKHGARIVTVHQLALGSELLLENRALGRTAKTMVAWLGDPPSVREPAEVGIQLVEAENIWGVELPPDDWQEGPPPKEMKKEISAAASPAVAVKPVEAPPTLPSSSPKTAAGAARPSDAELTVGAEEAPCRDERGIEKGTEYREIELRLQAARGDLEALHTKIRELQKLYQSETERVQQEIRAAGGAAVQSVSEELNQKVREGIGSIDGKVKEHSEQLARQMDSMLNEFKSQSERLLGDVEARLEKASLEVGERALGSLRENLERTSKEFTATFTKDFQIRASSSLGPLLDELNDAGTKAVEQARKQLTAISEQTRNSLEKESAKLADEQSARLKNQIQNLYAKESGEVESAVKDALEKHREAFLNKFQEDLEKSYLTSREKSLAEFRQSLRDELLRQFEEAARDFDKRTQENLELFTDQLKEKKAESVAQATELFRNKIGQMFLAPQAGAAPSSEGKGGK